MIVIVCVDDNLGMMFNNRRQSRDIEVVKKVGGLTKGSWLWMNKYSYELFEELDCNRINIDSGFLSETANGEYCFVENTDLEPYEKWVEKIIIFRWNTVYPSDRELDIDLKSWQLIENSDFVGKSHKKITMEVYIK
ncbi:MAG: ribonuclease Z [Clostridia bacterium]|nr:ribonuclease Z [Clostridia bacterium]